MRTKILFSASFILLILAVSWLAVGTPPVSKAGSTSSSAHLTEFVIPPAVGSAPLNIALEAPGRIWFTMPAANAIGSLIVTSTVEYQFSRYDVPTANSEPYDLVYKNGYVWFTQRAGNQIGRLNTANGLFTEFVVPTPNSKPAGIGLAPDGTVWFVERAGNNVSRLNPASGTFTVFPYPAADAALEDVFVQNDDSIWVTAFNLGRLVNFRPSRWGSPSAFFNVPAGSNSQPFGVTVASDGFPWITAQGTNRVGRFTPTTLSDWRWWDIPTAGSGLTGIALSTSSALNYAWFTERSSGKVGQLITLPTGQLVSLAEYQLPSPNSQPHGIAVDSSHHVWIAAHGSNMIARWQPPYFHFAYLPIVARY
jgi:virginiamycin B lyase